MGRVLPPLIFLAKEVRDEGSMQMCVWPKKPGIGKQEFAENQPFSFLFQKPWSYDANQQHDVQHCVQGGPQGHWGR
eukprot:scaffold19916_cov15-Tisochrysis_lutea.AAC.1